MDINCGLPNYLNSESQRTTSNKSIVHLGVAVVLKENNIAALRDWWINRGFIIKGEVKWSEVALQYTVYPFLCLFWSKFPSW